MHENDGVDGLSSEAISPRETQVLDGVRDHLTNAEIARRLHISVRTVESHVSALLRKTGVNDRRQLVEAGAISGRLGGVTGLVDLPSPWTTFVGRAAELVEVDHALASSRLVTLVGTGGVGKTRLATTAAGLAASRFTAGGAFVDLVPVGPEFLVEAVAAALGVMESPQEPLQHTVHQRLNTGPMLLALDNCEHLLAKVAAFTSAALAACPDLKVLTTSREPLAIAGEKLIRVGPLAMARSGASEQSDAERLFLERIGDDAPVKPDDSRLAEICRRLEGVPLAIELAAARAHSLGLDGLLVGLDDHLRLLSRRGGDDDRHASMRSVVDWSHRLLAEEERTLFRRLGVFAGSFDLAAATAVGGLGDPIEVSDLIGRLADKSLLVRGPDPVVSRWRMLEIIRGFALEHLASGGEEAATRLRHLVWAEGTAARIEAVIDDGGDWRPEFDTVADDLRAALRAAQYGAGDGYDYRLALALGHLSYARRFLVESSEHLRDAAVRATTEDSAVTALELAGAEAWAEMRGEAAFYLLRAASNRAEAAGDRRRAAIALADAAAIAGRCPALFTHPVEHEDLLALVARAQTLVPTDDVEATAHVALAAAWDGAGGLSVPDEGRAETALVMARRTGDLLLLSSALDANASAAGEAGCYRKAWAFTRQRLPLLEELPRHDPRSGGEVADIFHMGTEWALGAGEVDEALAVAQHQHQDSSSRGLQHFAASHLVVPLTLLGRFDEALEQSASMRQGWERAGRPVAGWMAPYFLAIALIHGVRGDQALYEEFVELAMAVRMKALVPAFSYFVKPRVALYLGDIDRAQRTTASPEGLVCGPFTPFARAFAVEVAVVAGAADAEAQLDAARTIVEENDFAATYLLRAAGRLHGDETLLKRAVGQWEAFGARFERACTLLLLPDQVAQGAAELAAMGCAVPTVFGIQTA